MTMGNTKIFTIGVISSVIAGFIVYGILKDKGDGKSDYDSQSSTDIKQNRVAALASPINMTQPKLPNVGNIVPATQVISGSSARRHGRLF